MRALIFSPAASTELSQAQDWYEQESPGLGSRFRHEIDVVLGRMSTDPAHFPIVYKSVRRALLRRFPYSLMFVINHDEDHDKDHDEDHDKDHDDTLIVIGCFHASRDPARWQRRT